MTDLSLSMLGFFLAQLGTAVICACAEDCVLLVTLNVYDVLVWGERKSVVLVVFLEFLFCLPALQQKPLFSIGLLCHLVNFGLC